MPFSTIAQKKSLVSQALKFSDQPFFFAGCLFLIVRKYRAASAIAPATAAPIGAAKPVFGAGVSVTVTLTGVSNLKSDDNVTS